MNQWTVVNANLLDSGSIIENQYVRVRDNTITEVGPMSGFRSGSDEILDARGNYLSPAYIDIHTHGASLYDAMDATETALDAICRFHFAHGVGTFLPTTLTAPLDSVQRLIDLLSAYQPPVPVSLPGIHMEGPFLSKVNRGAQPEKFLLTPDKQSMSFMERNQKSVRLITISPDVTGICDLISWCTAHGIVVSGGHDAAVDDDILKAISAGMSGVTHIFCCSSTISRKDGSARKHLGLTEIGLLDDGLYVEAIADNCHLPPDLLRLLYKSKGWERICLVSDSIRAAGMAPGNYLLGGNDDGVEVTVSDDVALLKDRSLFAGSITPLDRMVQNAVAAGIPLAHAAAMASEIPSRVLRLHDRGRIAAGCSAQMNLLNISGELLEILWDGYRYRKEIPFEAVHMHG